MGLAYANYEFDELDICTSIIIEFQKCYNCSYKEVADNGRSGNESRKVILSHYPIPFYKHSNNSKYYMLCGHVHTTAENDQLERLIRELRENYRSDACVHAANCGQIYNVGCMMPWMKYTPRTLDEIIRGREVYATPNHL